MGLESYILTAAFKKPLDQKDILEIFRDAGASFLIDKSNTENLNDFRHWYFEVRSDLGLTEIDVLLVPNKNFATTWSIRFSILSPSSVIDQTFDFLKKLKSIRSVNVFDTQNNSKELDLDVEDFKLNKVRDRKRQIIIDNQTGLIIEGGSATTNHIHDNGLMEKIWKIK